MALYVFPAIVHKEGETFGVVYPDLPGCVSVGDSQTEIALNASEALTGHLELMLDHEDRIPEPSALETLKLDPARGDIGMILVTAYAATSKTAA